MRYRDGSSVSGLLADYDVMPSSRQETPSNVASAPAVPTPELTDAASVSHIAVQPVVDTGSPMPVEIGGREGPEPTRFGDWEKRGRCIDF